MILVPTAVRRCSNPRQRTGQTLPWLIALFLSAMILLASGRNHCNSAESGTDLSDIKRAWSAQPSSIGPFSCEVSVTEQKLTKRPNPTGDPFGSPKDKSPIGTVTIEKTISAKRDGAKAWTWIRGSHWDEDAGEVFHQESTLAFDGTVHRNFTSSSRSPVRLGAFGDGGTEIEQQSRPPYIYPMNYWCNPKGLFAASGPSLEDLRVSDEALTFEGKKAIKLELFYQGTRRMSFVLTAERPYIPLQLERYSRRQVLAQRASFKYARDPTGFIYMDSWSDIYFSVGELSRRSDGVVKQFHREATLDNENFKLDFPVGTNIIQYTRKDKKFWIQRTIDTMEPIKPSEYGALPKAKPAPVPSDL